MFTLSNVLDLFMEPEMVLCTVFDLRTGEIVFSGDACDIPDEYLDCEVASIDTPDSPRLTFNIETSEEED